MRDPEEIDLGYPPDELARETIDDRSSLDLSDVDLSDDSGAWVAPRREPTACITVVTLVLLASLLAAALLG